MKHALALVTIVLIAPMASAATWNVPGDFATIQSAINFASPGDVIQVAPGTYSETIDFSGKALTVLGTGGPAVTTISAPSGGSVVTFQSGEVHTSVLEGFTIRDGTGTAIFAGTDTFGGGLLISAASPTVRDCVIRENTAQGFIFAPGGSGGGVYATSSSARFENTTFESNTADDEGGGVWASTGGTIEFIACTFRQNIAAGSCGGGLCSGGSILVEDSLFENNAFAQFGGGISLNAGVIRRTRIINNGSLDKGGGLYIAGSPLIEDCEISGNSAGLIFGDGGGIFCSGGAPTITRCVISNNRASSAVSFGGGIATSGSSAIITSSLIVNNTSQAGGSTAYGGGMSISGGAPVLTNVTIADNWAQDEGGGLWITNTASPVITNVICWDNTAPLGAEIHDPSAVATVTYSDVLGSWPGVGNIDADPLFVDAAGGDYHLTVNSPCFDAGSDVAPDLPAQDFEGDNRIHYAHADMGADEYSGCAVLMETYGVGLAGSGGFVPRLFGDGRSCDAGGHFIRVREGLGGAACTLWVALNEGDFPAFGGTLFLDLGSPFFLFNLALAGPSGAPGRGFVDVPGGNVNPFPGLDLYLQFTILDPGAPLGVSLTNAMKLSIGE